jgi:hypothetical protein
MLWNIANAVCKFQIEYWKKNENYLEAPIFNNDFFLCEKPRPRAAVPGSLKWSYIRRNVREEYLNEIMSLKMKSIIVDGNIVEYNRFRASTGVPFSVNEYMYISTGARYAREKYGNQPDSNGKNKCIVAAVYALKGRSKNFRRFLDLKHKVKSINEIQTVKKFFELIEVLVPDPDLSGVLHSIWNIHVLPNNLRVFAFQFYNNSLATNTRLAARYRADPVIRISDRCAFCIAGGLVVPAREDFFHVFFQCIVIKDCINKYVERYSTINDLNDIERKKNFIFTGTTEGWRPETVVAALQNIIFLYGIWQCKLNRKIPSFVTVENNMLTVFDNSVLLSQFLSELASTGVSPICRLWRHRTGRG